MNQIAVIGMAAMGRNLAKNFASRGINVAVFNRSFNKTQELLDEKNDNIVGYEDLKGLVLSLETPRKIIIMVKSGAPVEETITQLRLILDKGDILIDCGNSNWKETLKKQEELEKVGLEFVGCGVSGGWEGALRGPSIMPGGKPEVVESILPYLQKAAAPDFTGLPCVTNVGLGPAGHFVKMVHNGIEYAIMQGLAEVLDILHGLGYDQNKIQEVFAHLNTGDNKSFLLDITQEILKTQDILNSGYLLDKIDYKAGAKGTGKWTVEEAMNLGVAVPNIYAGLNARVMTETNHNISTFTKGQPKLDLDLNEMAFDELKAVLYEVVKGFYFTSYGQGIELIFAANKEYNWKIDIQEVLRIWQGGCIIRSKMLLSISKMYIEGQYPTAIHDQTIIATNDLTHMLSDLGLMLSMPVIHASRDYILAIESKTSPQNLTQAQRDFFGAHTYLRNDKEGTFSGGWNTEIE
jgi:6-phosphogluconate dehydrogenase